MSVTKWYQIGEDNQLYPIAETEARNLFVKWREHKDDNGKLDDLGNAQLLTDQLWTEIDRLRELFADRENIIAQFIPLTGDVST